MWPHGASQSVVSIHDPTCRSLLGSQIPSNFVGAHTRMNATLKSKQRTKTLCTRGETRPDWAEERSSLNGSKIDPFVVAMQKSDSGLSIKFPSPNAFSSERSRCPKGLTWWFNGRPVTEVYCPLQTPHLRMLAGYSVWSEEIDEGWMSCYLQKGILRQPTACRTPLSTRIVLSQQQSTSSSGMARCRSHRAEPAWPPWSAEPPPPLIEAVVVWCRNWSTRYHLCHGQYH
jgi:hypothetical protein